MAEFEKRTYYFKLVREKSYYFRVDSFDFMDANLIFVHSFSNDMSLPTTKEQFEKLVNTWMTDYGVTYHELSEEEVEKVKLIYEV